MPWTVEKRGRKHCLYKEGKNGRAVGKTLGCHDTPKEAWGQAYAIDKSEKRARKKALKAVDDEGRRLMFIVTSNAYRDREREIISEKALRRYTELCWKGAEFVGESPLLLWHGGDPIGDIVYTDMEGPFLFEVARERPNAVVNLAADGDPPLYGEVEKVWDGLEAEDDLGASHEFAFIAGDRKDGVYEAIVKTETTGLPRAFAANAYTYAEVIRREEHDE